MFEHINQLVINDSLKDKAYILAAAVIIAGYLIYTVFALVAINLSLSKLKKAKRLIEEGHKQYRTARYFGQMKGNNRVLLKESWGNVPNEEDRHFLFS